jgi:hypothetical protein
MIRKKNGSAAFGSTPRRVIAFLMALVALAAMSEAALRFGLGLGNPILIALDPACGYIVKPDQNVVRFFGRTYINHYGMRSDEVPLVHRPDTLRLLFLGDSITYGTSRVNQSRIFTEILHRELPLIVHRPVEVLNASASAWAPDNELSYIRSRGIFQSDIVLLVLNDGDVAQPRATIADIGDDLPQRRPTTAIGELYTRYIRPRIFYGGMRRDAGDSPVVNTDNTIRENLADLDSIEKLVTGSGARLLIVYVPFRRDVPEQSAAAQSILLAWTNAHRVALLDLTSAELIYSCEEITIDHGWHFNAKGHRIVAQAIEKAWPIVAGNEH